MAPWVNGLVHKHEGLSLDTNSLAWLCALVTLVLKDRKQAEPRDLLGKYKGKW